MSLEYVNPPAWKTPRGYENGVVAPKGARILFVSGQIAWDAEQRLVGADRFSAQFQQALANVLSVVQAAGGEAEHLASLTIFVTDKQKYLQSRAELGLIWRRLIGRTYPAVALVEVSGLLEPGALVEIQATAALP